MQATLTPAARFLAFVAVYNRSTKHYEVEVSGSDSPIAYASKAAVTVMNGTQGVAFGLGQLVAGNCGEGLKAEQKQAIADAMIGYLGGTNCAKVTF